MRIRLVNTGSFQGILLPKSVVQKAGLTEELDLDVRGDSIIIRSHRRPRESWAEAASACHRAVEDQLDDMADMPAL